MTGEKRTNKAEYIFGECKFGIFIHWGLYSIPGGIWKGKEFPFIGEWIMKRARIPVKEYEKLALEFNPINFDAERWVELVKRSGAKYLVFTAKHHDGFAMYHSKVSPYNVVEATPFRRDPLEEIAVACNKYGVELGIYYSHDQDWHDPNGTGNDWDYTPDDQKHLTRYLREKAEPQIEELFTNYGPISMVWFDTPFKINQSQSRRIMSLVRKLQPECLINGRIGHELGDYVQQGDNEIPVRVQEGYWEVPATMNDTWGYKHGDNNWKSAHSLLINLVDVISKGGNYLLNIGPSADGSIPEESERRLSAIGEWIKLNCTSIRGVQPNPFIYEFPWGAVTAHSNRLYLHLFNNTEDKLMLYGLRNKVNCAYVLSNNMNHIVDVFQHKISGLDCFVTHLFLPSETRKQTVPVVVLELDENVDVDLSLLPHSGGALVLEASLAEIHENNPDKPYHIECRGWIKDWYDTSMWLSWKFRIIKPGTYKVSALTSTFREDGDPASPMQWDGGHKIRVESAGKKLFAQIQEDRKVHSIRNSYYPHILTDLGEIEFLNPGTYDLRLIAEHIVPQALCGFTFRSINLSPITHKQKIISDNRNRIKEVNMEQINQ